MFLSQDTVTLYDICYFGYTASVESFRGGRNAQNLGSSSSTVKKVFALSCAKSSQIASTGGEIAGPCLRRDKLALL